MSRKKRSLAGFDDVASDNKSDNINDSNSASNNASKDDSEDNSTTTKDSENVNTTATNSKIDMLLQERKKSNKTHYIGFYATDEVKKFLDQVPSGNKSAIINEALKIVMQK